MNNEHIKLAEETSKSLPHEVYVAPNLPKKDQVRVGVAVNVVKYGHYLLLKRKSELGTDTWCPPGGKMEFGEDIIDCALREFREEVGDDIQISKPEFYCITNDFFEKENQHFITIQLVAFYESGEPIINEPDKFSDIGWFYTDNVEEMDLFLPTRNFFNNNLTIGDN
jgi:8-oxo-dGTP diphosphatase